MRLFSDTPPDMEALQFALWRQASLSEKMTMLDNLVLTTRRLMLTGLRERYPNADETELRRRLADLWLSPELARALAEAA